MFGVYFDGTILKIYNILFLSFVVRGISDVSSGLFQYYSVVDYEGGTFFESHQRTRTKNQFEIFNYSFYIILRYPKLV